MKSFPIGGVHPSENKLSREQAIEVLALPDTVTVLLSQHIGAPSVPSVKKGDKVKAGDVLGTSAAGLSVCTHASIDGEVLSVTGDYVVLRGAKN